jgi:hypothetical protein
MDSRVGSSLVDAIGCHETTWQKAHNNTMHAEPPTARVLNGKITPAAQ